MEKTVNHFCTTAKRIKKDAVEFAKQATMIAGMSAMVVTTIERETAEYQYPLHWNMERQPQIWSWDGYDGGRDNFSIVGWRK